MQIKNKDVPSSIESIFNTMKTPNVETKLALYHIFEIMGYSIAKISMLLKSNSLNMIVFLVCVLWAIFRSEVSEAKSMWTYEMKI